MASSLQPGDLTAALDQTYAAWSDSVRPALDAMARSRLIDYVGLIAQWNAVYNLTAVRDPADMLAQHIFDSLAVVTPMRGQLTKTQAPEPSAAGQRVLDVGSGAGLPGVVIAITCPDLTVVCVDAVAKKASFIRQVAAQLRLPNLQSHHARVEDLLADPFQLITSRAFASLADFTRLTRRHLAADGVWMAMKGKAPIADAPERVELPADVNVFHVEQLHVPGLSAERCLVWMCPA